MWQLLFWVSIFVVLYSYFGYPLLLFLIGKSGRRRSSNPAPVLERPTVCLIISAFNEETVIYEKIQNSLSQKYPADKLTILVVSDGSTDRTVEIARGFSDYGVEVHHWPQRRGKSAVLNDVVPGRSEDVIVFTDANSQFSPDAINTLVKGFSDLSIGCVVGRLRYVDNKSSSVGKGEGVYWRYEGMVSRLESALASVLVANGSIFAIRKGFFRELYAEVANDFQIPIDVAAQGAGIIYEPRAEAIEHTTELWREEFQRKVRIILRGLTGYSILSKRIRGFRFWQFVSHKLLRWMVGLFLLTALAANAVLVSLESSPPVYTGLLLLQTLFYAFAMVGSRFRHSGTPRKIFYVPFYFTMVNAAALAGLIKYLGGRRQKVWEKAESTRLATVSAGSERPDGEAVEATTVNSADSMVDENEPVAQATTARIAKN